MSADRACDRCREGTPHWIEVGLEIVCPHCRAVAEVFPADVLRNIDDQRRRRSGSIYGTPEAQQ